MKKRKKKVVITHNDNKKRDGIEFIPLYKFILDQQ